MTRLGKIDLTGSWTGFFNYPVALPPTPFEAELRETAGRITGTTAEPGGARSSGGTLNASVEGRREGMKVRFAKAYDRIDERHDLVFYDGAIGADGDEIAGRWAIPGAWSGTFLMVRASGADEAAEREAAEEVSADY